MRAEAAVIEIEEHTAAALLERMRRGDRDAAAEFLVGYGPLIRRRIRGKLGAAMRRLFDSQEILSTVGRRLDAFVNAGRLEATTTPQLWGLVLRIAENALVEKARVVRSLNAREGEDSPFAQQVLRRMEHADARTRDGAELELDAALRSLHDGVDREILSLWLLGNQLNHIAEHVDLAPTAVRKRWEKIRHHLRSQYLRDAC